MKMPEEFLIKISKLGNKTDEIVSKALEAGGEVVLDKVKTNLKSVIGNGTKEKSRSTGELVSSLGLSPTKLDKNGNFNIKIGFNEPRGDGDANAKIANILEYGKYGQPPKPFLKPAKSASRKACIETMKSELDKEIEKL
jgi:HK97 gp10 family phage protein